MTRTFVLGLDGASWRLVEPWIEAGDLPNLSQLRNEGTWATSRSCLPPVTFPNWKCYSAGKNPGKFGVYWFERIDLERGRIDVMNGQNFKTAELWDYLNDAGYSAGVVNMPTMYPPRELDGIVVAGGPDAVSGEYRSIDSGYASPSSFVERLETEYDYQVHPEPLLSSNEERGEEVDAILELLDKRLQVAYDLYVEDELDFVHVTLFYLNVLHHFFWDEEPTKRAWKLVDEWVGELSELEGTNLVLMSDHGSAATTTEFYINEWLAENGYQRRTRSAEYYFRKIGLTRENALRLAKRAGLVNFLANTVPESVQELVPQSAGAKRERKLEQVVLSETRAVASAQGPVYLNPDFDADEVSERLIEDLREVSDENGDPIFTDVYRGDEVYDGPYVGDGPEVVVDQRPGIHVNDGMGRGVVQTKPDRWAAENTRDGIFVASGPDFEARGEIDPISITDIAPTVLTAYGLDVPTDMDGSIIPSLADGPTGSRDPIRIDTANGSASDDVADRLKQLGYME
ncbi:alkaline phosphatase family protein [Halostella litorea]|uniref:alkaline phosphatase family protein n=1 Tax=Halostella litorea TaxID=2528831 RepID=UPI001091D8BC|nr:alkaline phosphatase family protein [Halostella litorea]